MVASPLRLELRASLHIAVPLALGQLAAVGMNVVDSLLAGRHGALTLAAVAVGSAVWSLALLIAVGVLMAVPPSVSQLVGAGRRAEVAPLFRQAIWLALALGLLLQGMIRLLAEQLAGFGIAAEVIPPAAEFLRAISWGAPALALHFAARYFSEGLGLARPTLVSGLAGLALLAPLGYLLMFGAGPLPAGGAGGLGAATAIVLWLQAGGFALWLAFGPRYREFALFARWQRPDPAALGRLLALGLPLGVSVFMEGSLFVAAGLLIGGIDPIAVAAHQIAINVASLCFMLPLGVAMACTVRVGFAAGAGDAAGIRRAAAAGLLIVLVTQSVSASALALFAAPIAALYSGDAAVQAAALGLLLLAALFQFSDGLQAVAAGALRGLKDTRRPMFLTAFAYWAVGMSCGAVLAYRYDWGAQGIWGGLCLGLSAAAVLLGGRLLWLLRRPDAGAGAASGTFGTGH